MESGDSRAIRESMGTRVYEALNTKGETLEDIRMVEIVMGQEPWEEGSTDMGEQSLTEVLQRQYQDDYATYDERYDGKLTFYTQNHVHQTYDYDGMMKIRSVRLHPR